MSWFWNNLLLWGSILWLPVLMHYMLCTEAKFIKNILMGVTLPPQAKKDEEVTAALQQFRQQSRRTCLWLTVAALPGLFIRSFGIGMMVWSIWLVAAIVVPNVPFVRCNLRLKALKKARGWQTAPSAAAELWVAAQPVRWLSPWHFVLPFVLSLLPLCNAAGRSLWFLYLMDAAFIPLAWVCYRYALRTKSDLVTDNIPLTAALTRIRRSQWSRCWLLCSWMMAALNLAVWLLLDKGGWMIAAVVGLSVLFTAAVLRVEFRTRRLQTELTAGLAELPAVDEDDHWPWGLIYYNPNDKKLMVNSRVGVGTTFNMAKRSAQIIMAATALLLLLLPLMGLWFLQLERTPVTLTVTETAVVAAHTKTEYEIPLEQIEAVELITERPSIGRQWGTGMDTVQKGMYSSPWGSIRVCIDPRSGPWVLVTTKSSGKYLLGATGGVAWPYGAARIELPAAG